MNQRINQIETSLAPFREQLKNHNLYKNLNSLDDIKIFMKHHVYAVWDFMSLLKSLQQSLTCTQVPWMPGKNPVLARFINEIVHGEESDVNELGEPQSHFQMYLDAMNEVGASTDGITNLIESLQTGTLISDYIDNCIDKKEIQDFLHFSFNTIQSNKTHCVASAFTFGREDVIPDMFFAIVRNAEKQDSAQSFSKLTYYLERHIEVDGGEHGPLSLKMINELCGDDDTKWKEVEEIAIDALNYRIGLWDVINIAIEVSHKSLLTVN
jgi:hypothetical protein